MERDRESIGLTAECQTLLSDIEARGWFQEGADIARFCLAFAVRAGVSDGSTTGTETRWAAGNFDKTGEIRALLAGLYPECETPVRLMEYLVNVGLRMVGERLRDSGVGPADLMEWQS
jgi:hypothetical protein